MLSKIFSLYYIFAVIFVPVELVLSKGTNPALALLPFFSMFFISGIRVIVNEIKHPEESDESSSLVIFAGALFGIVGFVPMIICCFYVFDFKSLQELFVNNIKVLVDMLFMLLGIAFTIPTILKLIPSSRFVTVEAKCIKKDITDEDGEPLTKLVFEYRYDNKRFKYTDDMYTEKNNSFNLGETILLEIDSKNPKNIKKNVTKVNILLTILGVLFALIMLYLVLNELIPTVSVKF